MTNEQLTAYLQDESYLYSVSYEELKTLVMQYPYSANLRILLLKKSYLDQNKDYDRNLQMSATYTTNRKHLYKTIKRLKSFQFASQNVILGEEYLELTELSNIERLLAERHVNEAVSSATKLDSLAQDWKLEIDDIAFNDDNENGALDLSNLSQNEEKPTTNHLKDEEDIDSLINSLVSEFNLPFSDLKPETVQNEADEAFLDEEEAQTPMSTHLDLAEFVAEKTDDVTPLDMSDFTPSVSDTLVLNDTDENDIIEEIIYNTQTIGDEEIIDTTPEIDEEEIIDDAILKLNDIESSLPLTQIIPTTEIPQITEKESEEDVKKIDIQLEIINQTKAAIIENKETKPAFDKKPSFTEWLSQFRMTPPQSPVQVASPVEKIEQTTENQTNIHSETDETTRRISRQNMVALFETEIDVPDSLFGLSDKNTPRHYVEEEDDDDDEVFSDYESNPQKKKKSRPMHQLAIKSLVQDNELVSETLADLLAWQGNKVKAIEMYRKLILQFPEKSSYFATKIEKISI